MENKSNKTLRIVIITVIVLVFVGVTAFILVDKYIESKISKIRHETTYTGPVITDTGAILDPNTGTETRIPQYSTEPETTDGPSFTTETKEEPVGDPEWPVNGTKGALYNGMPRICDTEDVINILLMGLDGRYGEAQRNDTTLLLSLNRRTGEINIASFLRDTLVDIPGHVPQKFNASFAFGGPELVKQTLRQNFNVDVNYYFYVNFYSFVDVVDALGGLDITMDRDEVSMMNFYLAEINYLQQRPEDTYSIEVPAEGTPAQTYYLNGAQALSYARNRYTSVYDPSRGATVTDDWGRVSRQRNVINLAFQKLKDLSILELNSFADKVLPLITTNMDAKLIKSFVYKAPTYLTYTMNSFTIPQKNYSSWWGYESGNIKVDTVKCSKALYETIYHEKAPEPEVTTAGT